MLAAMSRLDDLPPDQRAALSLLLRQHKSYAEVAALLSIRESAVRDRAHAALVTLSGGDLDGNSREPSAARREDIGDYLLGQQTGAGARLATRAYLDESAEGREWARAIAAELAPLTPGPLPEIPGDAERSPDSHGANDQPSAAAVEPGGKPGIHALRPGIGGSRPGSRAGASVPSSRRGGALLLGAILAAVVVAVILIVGSGGKSHHSSGAGRSSASAGSTGGPTVNGRYTLTSPNPASKAVGAVEVLSEGDKHAFYIAADHLPASKGFFYAVWLYNSPTSHQALSRSPPVGSNGRLEGGALLPANAREFHRMLVTRETSVRPPHPGPVVLSGPFSLGG
jgi:hypothetical protein